MRFNRQMRLIEEMLGIRNLLRRQITFYNVDRIYNYPKSRLFRKLFEIAFKFQLILRKNIQEGNNELKNFCLLESEKIEW